MSDISLTRRTIVRHEIPSRILKDGTRSIRVYLPPGYQEVLSYPVIYCQDGEDFFNFGRIATISHRLILEEDWDPYIIVGIDVNKHDRTSEYRTDGELHSSYLSFFAEELIPYVEQQFSVRRTPEERLLAGDSLGGAVSLSLALRYPLMFTRILSLSGAYYEEILREIQSYQDLSPLSLWMTVGLQETDYQTDHGKYNFVELNRTARRVLEARGAYVDYREKNGEHKWGFWQSELPEALGAFLGPDAHM